MARPSSSVHSRPFRTKIGSPHEGHALRRFGTRLSSFVQYGQTFMLNVF